MMFSLVIPGRNKYKFFNIFITETIYKLDKIIKNQKLIQCNCSIKNGIFILLNIPFFTFHFLIY